MLTSSIKKDEIKRDWFIVDADNKTLGRLASEIAQVIRGKKKPNFTPNLDMGDFVVVINAEKVVVTGSKEEQKKYFDHFGLMLAYEDENSIFFRGSGTAPYAYVATKGKENKYIGTAYKANDYSDLEALSKEFNVDIVENTEPGGGHKVTVIDPDGIEAVSYTHLTLPTTR